MLEKLPTYTVPRRKKYRPVVRLAKLAGLLAQAGIVSDPVKTYRAALVKVLLDSYEQLKDDKSFRSEVLEAGILDIARVRVQYAAQASGASETDDEQLKLKAKLADVNVDDVFADAGRLLGEGLPHEYARARKDRWETSGTKSAFPMRTVKLEAWALASAADVMAAVNDRATKLANEWVRSYKAAFAPLDERFRQQLREIEGATDEPQETTLEVPQHVEWSKAKTAWDKHVFVEEDGSFHEDFSKSSWERTVIEQELENEAVVGWLRSVDRKPWAVCAPYKRGNDWVGTYPDFLIFRKTKGGLIADIVDPHLLSDENAPGVGPGRLAP